MSKSSKTLAILTGLMTMMALVLPLAGGAWAGHGSEPIAVVDLEPEQDSASTGTCNPYTIVATDDDGDVAENEGIDVIASQEFPESESAPALEFCAPTTTPGGQQAQNPTARTEDTECPTEEDPNEDCRIIHGEFTTDAEGRVVFGIRSNREGEVRLTAFAEGQNPACPAGSESNNAPDECEPQDTAMKTFTAGGQAGGTTIDCEPKFATNNLDAGDSTHTFTCTVTNVAGDPVAGAEVDFVVTDGPNAQHDVLPLLGVSGSCTTTTGAGGDESVGEAACSYDEDADLEAGEPGTDTIVAFVDQDGDDTPDAGEPQEEIQKAWTNAPRNIDCGPNTATNESGQPHEVTCTVIDRNGLPVGDVVVSFTENGPGRFEGDTNRVTDDQGQVAITATTQPTEQGTQEITGTITDEDASTGGIQGGNNAANAECHRAENSPSGAQEGNCAEMVLKSWVEGEEPPPPPPPACPGFEGDSRSQVVGTPNDDVLVGTGGDDVMCGLGGDDSITGGGGDDILMGGPGNDVIRGGPGDDILRGGSGDDTLRGGSGNDTLRGGGGADTLRGGSGRDTLRGGPGPDTLLGNRGHDILRGGRGHDTLRGGRGNDIHRGGPGTDLCRDNFGNNIFRSCERR